MKKLQFLVYHRDYENFLVQLRDLGVAHLSTRAVKLGENEALDAQVKRTEELHLIVQQLEALKVDGVVANQIDDYAVALTNVGDAKKGVELAERVMCINDRIKEAEIKRINLTAQVEALTPWGDFDPACRNIIAQAGRTLSFHSVPCKMWNDKWTEECPAFLVNELNKVCYFITIDEPVADGIEVLHYTGATTLDLPQVRLCEAMAELEEVRSEVSHLYTDLQIIARQGLDDITAAWKESQNEVTFDSVVQGTDTAADNTLMVLTGWIPAKVEAEVDAFCQKSDAWYEISTPAIDDAVPTKMENSVMTSLFESLVNMYGTPNYREFDVTGMVAVFFSLFFGMCVGDAGYGLILFFGAYPLCNMLKNVLSLDINPKLVKVLGATSAIVGFLLGTAFGVNIHELDISSMSDIGQLLLCWLPYCQPFMLSGKFMGTGFDTQMVLAIAIGVLHICIAMFTNAYGIQRLCGFRAAITAWAWWVLVVAGIAIGLVWGATNVPPTVCKYMLLGVGLVCAIGIFFLNSPGKSVIANIGSGAYDTYNKATGLLGDILSYVRLYALGLAGGMLGDVFNMLAGMLNDGLGSKIGWIFALALLLFGHTLNLAMSCLSAFVHPLRLTFVEYFKNSGYQGDGIAFQSFAKE